MKSNIILERYNEGKRFLLNKNIRFTRMNEALIRSYDLNRIQNEMKRAFPEIISIEKKRNSPYVEDIGTDVTEGTFIGSFEIKLSTIKDIYSIKDEIEHRYGWHASLLIINREYKLSDFGKGFEVVSPEHLYGCSLKDCMYLTNGTDREYSLFVEANYTKKINITEPIFHITHTSRLNRIRRNGLVPKSKANYPDRVYFGTDINRIITMIGINKYYDDKDIIPSKTLLRLDVDKYKKDIESKYTFYADPRDETSFFTYDTISPEYLSVCIDDINDFFDIESYIDDDTLNSLRFKPLI